MPPSAPTMLLEPAAAAAGRLFEWSSDIILPRLNENGSAFRLAVILLQMFAKCGPILVRRRGVSASRFRLGFAGEWKEEKEAVNVV
jgi:hypothetical protein